MRFDTFFRPFHFHFWIYLIGLLLIFSLFRMLLEMNNPYFKDMNIFQKLILSIQSSFSGLIFDVIIKSNSMIGKFMDFGMKTIYLVFICLYIANLGVFLKANNSITTIQQLQFNQKVVTSFSDIIDRYTDLLESKHITNISDLVLKADDTTQFEQITSNKAQAVITYEASPIFALFSNAGLCSKLSKLPESFSLLHRTFPATDTDSFVEILN